MPDKTAVTDDDEAVETAGPRRVALHDSIVDPDPLPPWAEQDVRHDEGAAAPDAEAG